MCEVSDISLNPFIEAACILACDVDAAAVFCGEDIYVFNDNNILAGCERDIRECKLNSFREFCSSQIDCRAADIFQLDKFRIGVNGRPFERMIHNLRNPQIVSHIAAGESRFG
jgi:hypothetical protein